MYVCVYLYIYIYMCIYIYRYLCLEISHLGFRVMGDAIFSCAHTTRRQDSDIRFTFKGTFPANLTNCPFGPLKATRRKCRASLAGSPLASKHWLHS